MSSTGIHTSTNINLMWCNKPGRITLHFLIENWLFTLVHDRIPNRATAHHRHRRRFWKNPNRAERYGADNRYVYQFDWIQNSRSLNFQWRIEGDNTELLNLLLRFSETKQFETLIQLLRRLLRVMMALTLLLRILLLLKLSELLPRVVILHFRRFMVTPISLLRGLNLLPLFLLYPPRYSQWFLFNFDIQ